MVTPHFFYVKEYGAVGDGLSMDTAAIQRTIDACAQAGGGTVYFAPGTYRSGSIELRSGITFHLEAGAVLRGSDCLDDYPLGHLLYARDASNLSITGNGTIDGQGQAFWRELGKDEIPDWMKERQGWGDVAHFYWRALPRPKMMIRLSGCSSVRIRDITLLNSPGWTLHLLACDHVTVSDITIRNPFHGPNTDGIDIDACRDVTITGCHIATGDDAIVLKNTNLENRRRPSRNITVANCILSTNCNGFKIGTETQESFENIMFSNSMIYNERTTDVRDRAISGVSIEMVDGAELSRIMVSNILMNNVRCPLFVRLGNRGRGQDTPVPGSLYDVMISNIQASGALLPFILSGIPDHPLSNISLSGIKLTMLGGAATDQMLQDVPEKAGEYPEAIMFGRWLPAYGLYCRHVDGLKLGDIDVELQQEDARPMMVCEDVRRLRSTI